MNTYEIPTSNGTQTVQANSKAEALQMVSGGGYTPILNNPSNSINNLLSSAQNLLSSIQSKYQNPPKLNTTITTKDINNYQPFQLQPQTNKNASMALGSSLPTPQDQIQEKSTTSTREQIQQQILDLIGKQGQRGQVASDIYAQEGVSEKRKLAESLTKQYDEKARAYDKKIEQIRENKAGLFGGAVEQEIANVERQKNSELANIAIQQKAAVGDYQGALDTADKLIAYQFEPLENQIKGLQTIYSLIQDDMTESEKMQAQFIIQQKQSDYEFQKQKELLKYKAGLDAQAQQEGIDAPLYAGLNGSTSAAVRGQVASFKSEPIVQNFSQIQSGYSFVKNLSNTTTNPADDQALIYSLAKTLDPGSVVREGEYATAQKYAQSWVNAYGKSISQALVGTGFLSEQARKNIKNTIESRYKAAASDYNNLRNNYAQGINNLTGRTNGSDFLRDYSAPGLGETTPQQSEEQAFDSVISQPSAKWSNFWSSLKGLFQ